MRGVLLARLAGALLLAAAVAGCASSRPRGLESEPRQPPDEPIPLEVSNEGFHEVTVYAMSGGTIHRLGNVISLGHQTFHIPHTILGGNRDLRVLAVRVGTRRAYMSGLYLVERGDELELTVVTPVEASFLDVYRDDEGEDGKADGAGEGEGGKEEDGATEDEEDDGKKGGDERGVGGDGAGGDGRSYGGAP